MPKFKKIVKVNMHIIHLSNHFGSSFFVVYNESLALK